MSAIDVIIPCHNYGRFLEQCVRSVLDQPVDVAALVIDDASTDGSADVAKRLAAADPRVRVRVHETNRGHIATYNEGLDWVTADYSLLLSADDLLTPGALGRAVRFMSAHPEAGLCFGRWIKFQDGDALSAPLADERGDRLRGGLEFIRACCAAGENLVPTPTVLLRTSLQRQLGGYLPHLPYTADLELWLRFAAHAPVGELDADQAYYRLHGANMSRQYQAERDLRQRCDAFDAFFARSEDLLDGPSALRRTARRALAEEAFWTADAMFNTGDSDGCAQLLSLALEIDPSISEASCWRRLHLKRLMGRHVWRLMRPTARLLRRPFAGRNRPTAAPTDSTRGKSTQH